MSSKLNKNTCVSQPTRRFHFLCHSAASLLLLLSRNRSLDMNFISISFILLLSPESAFQSRYFSRPPTVKSDRFSCDNSKKSQLTSLKYLIYMYLQSPPSISIALQLLSLYNIIDMNVFVLRARKQYDDKNISM